MTTRRRTFLGGRGAFEETWACRASLARSLVTGKSGTMRHDMKLVTGKAMVGRAVTSLARPAPPEGATPALATRHSVEMIDAANPGEVGVIVFPFIRQHKSIQKAIELFGRI